MATTSELKNQVATRDPAANGNGQVQRSEQPSLAQLIEQMKPQFARALPKHLDADRLARIALTTLRQTPALQRCTPESFLGALMTCAQTGLEPGPLGHAYLVPYGREVVFIPGYRGLIDLARRSGNIESLIAREVYEKDKFHVAYGLEDRLEHEPTILGDRGDVVAYYAVARYVGGGHAFIVMSRADIEKIRKRSRAKDSGPWQTDYDAMAKKTCIRQLAKFLPLSVEMAEVLAQDEQVRTDLSPDAIDATPRVIDADVVDDGPPPGVDDDGVIVAEVVDEPDPASNCPECGMPAPDHDAGCTAA